MLANRHKKKNPENFVIWIEQLIEKKKLKIELKNHDSMMMRFRSSRSLVLYIACSGLFLNQLHSVVTGLLNLAQGKL